MLEREKERLPWPYPTLRAPGRDLAVESQQVVPVEAQSVKGWLAGQAGVGSVPVVAV